MKTRSIINDGVANLLPNTERTLDYILIERISDNPYQPRTINIRGEDFENLKNNIKVNGLDTPILVIRKGRKDFPDHFHFILIQGQRRLLAVKELGYGSILANILEFDEEYIQKKLPLHSLLENIQRKNLHFLDEIKGLYLVAKVNFGVLINDGEYYQNDEKISVLNLAQQLYTVIHQNTEYLRKKLSLYLVLHNNNSLQDQILEKGYKLQDIFANKRIRDSLFQQTSSEPYKNNNTYKIFKKTFTKLQDAPELNRFIKQSDFVLPIHLTNEILDIPKPQLKILKKAINNYAGIIDQLMKGDINFD